MINLNTLSYSKNIKYPIISKKTIILLKQNQYTFITDQYIDKHEIKKTIESLFKIKIVKINSYNIPKKKIGNNRLRHKKIILTVR